MPVDGPVLSIVIVTYNSSREIAACLASVTAHRPFATDVLVVDNGSTDDTVALVRGSFPSVRVLDLGRNEGFARANNRGAAASAAPLLLLLNPDTVVGEGALERLAAALERHPDVAVVGPRLVDE